MCDQKRGPWECRNSNDSRELRGRDGREKYGYGIRQVAEMQEGREEKCRDTDRSSFSFNLAETTWIFLLPLLGPRRRGERGRDLGPLGI